MSVAEGLTNVVEMHPSNTLWRNGAKQPHQYATTYVKKYERSMCNVIAWERISGVHGPSPWSMDPP